MFGTIETVFHDNNLLTMFYLEWMEIKIHFTLIHLQINAHITASLAPLLSNSRMRLRSANYFGILIYLANL